MIDETWSFSKIILLHLFTFASISVFVFSGQSFVVSGSPMLAILSKVIYSVFNVVLFLVCVLLYSIVYTLFKYNSGVKK